MTDTEACPTCGHPVRTQWMASSKSEALILEPVCNHTDCHDQVAALAGAAIQPRPNGHKWCALCGMWALRDQEIDHAQTCVLANLPAEAKEIAAKAQAHDVMKAALRRYGRHGMDCSWTRRERGDCACGFMTALAEKGPE